MDGVRGKGGGVVRWEKEQVFVLRLHGKGLVSKRHYKRSLC